MFSRIAHVAIYTESYEKMAGFYKTIFGMKQITSGMADESGQTSIRYRAHKRRNHRPCSAQEKRWIRSGLDHFGFDVKDIKTALDKISEILSGYPSQERSRRRCSVRKR